MKGNTNYHRYHYQYKYISIYIPINADPAPFGVKLPSKASIFGINLRKILRTPVHYINYINELHGYIEKTKN